MNRIITLLTLVCGLTLTTSLMAANVAKIGDTEYATISAALSAVPAGGTIELLADAGCTASIVLARNFTLEGNGYTLTCTGSHSKYDYFINVSGGSTQTFRNVTIDAAEKEPYAMQCIGSASKLILDNVTIKNAKGTSSVMGYGIHVNGGTVEANNLKVSNCTTASVYLDGNKTQGKSPSFTLTGDDCDFDVVGSSDGVTPILTSTAKGFYSYYVEAKYKWSIFLFPKKVKVISALSWNKIIEKVGVFGDITIQSAKVKLLQNVTLSETFTPNDSNLSIDGNGYHVTGTIDLTSSSSTLTNFVLGNGSTIIPPSGELTDHTPSSLSLSLADGACVWSNDKKYCQNGDAFKVVPLAQIDGTKYATVEEALAEASTGSKLKILDAGLVAENVSALVTTGPAQPSSPSGVAMLLGADTFTVRDSGLLAADGKVLVYEYNLGIRAMTFTPEGFVLTIGLEESGETITRTFPNRCRWIVVFVGDKKVASRELTKIGDGSPTVVLPQETVLGTTPDGGSLTNRITFKITDEEPESEESTL